MRPLPLRWLPSVCHAFRIIRKEKPDCLGVSHVLPMGYVAWLCKRFFGLPYVVFAHGTDLLSAATSKWKRRLAARVLKEAAFVAVNSGYTRGLAAGFGVPEEKTELIYPCPAPGTVPGRDASPKRRSDDPERRKTLLTVARLVPRKGIDRMIALLPALAAEFPGLKYVIVGAGPEEERLRALALELKTGSAVRFAGKVAREALPGHYESADVFILPGRDLPDDVEGFGMALLEASAHGLPVVAGRTGGVHEAVIDGATGILVDPDSDEELGAAVAGLLRQPEKAGRLGEAGRKRVLEEFVWERQAAKLTARLGGFSQSPISIVH